MKQNNSINEIPIRVEGKARPRNLHWPRRIMQVAVLLLAVLVPASGLFRIDPLIGTFVVLDRQIWFADFFIVVGLWLTLSSTLVMTYSFIGTAFCGWVCPQNTMSEWANHMTHKWLGKRAEVNVTGSKMDVSAGKNKILNWVVLGLMFTVASLLLALMPLFYFYPPDVIWSFVSFRDDERLASSLYWIYAIFVIMILLNVAFIRNFWCKFMCIYRVWQHSFKTRDTLRISYEQGHDEECKRCNYCQTSCLVDIDPRNTETFDSCINCGECIVACNAIRGSRKTGHSLLRFVLGEDKRIAARGAFLNMGSFFGRVKMAMPLAVLGLSMFVWGLWDYNPYHMSVYRADINQGESIDEYRIHVANKRYQTGRLSFEIEGLDARDYVLESDYVQFVTIGKQDVGLTLNKMKKGLYRFIVHARSDDGWQGSFRVHHLSSGK